MAETESKIVIVKQFPKDFPRKDLVTFFSHCGNINALTMFASSSITHSTSSVADQADATLGIAIVTFKETATAKIAVQLAGAFLGGK